MKLVLLLLVSLLVSCVNQEGVKTAVTENKSELVALAETTEKTVVVFWRASCGPCIKEMQTLNESSHKVVALNVSGEDLKTEIRKLNSKLDSPVKANIKIIEGRELFTKLDLGFVPFSVVVENKDITNFFIGYNDKF